jgi:hypothetical protein
MINSIILYISDNIWLITTISIFIFIISLLMIPYLLIRIPHDYFTKSYVKPEKIQHPVLKFLELVIRNTIGLLLVVFGIIMLFTPGQGLISLITGLSLIDFPYKKQVERKIISIPKVLLVINNIRRNQKHSDLLID